MDVSDMREGDFAGLALLQKKYGWIGVKYENGVKKIVMVSAQTDKPEEVESLPLNQNTVFLKAECDFTDKKDIADFYYSLDGKTIVLEEAEHAGATEVLGVYLTVGYSRDIVEDVFESMFAWMCRGTVAEGAVLHLTRVPFTVRCEECGRIFPVNTRCRDTPRCPQCGASHYRLHSGMEFYVNDIEVKTDPTAVRALAS